MSEHVVRQGESILSLSRRYGVPSDSVFNHPDNAELRDRNRDLGILHPGDRITIPDLEIKEVTGATDQRHQFRCTNRNTWLRVQFFTKDEPRANEPYVVRIGTQEIRGELNAEGWLEVRVPADTQEAVLLLGDESNPEQIDLRVGNLDPVDEVTGLQQRLNNLGFFCGEESGEQNPDMQEALRMFQAKHGLEQTGELDDATRDRLRQIHGC
jgi:Putative peptidoglycan binding domain